MAKRKELLNPRGYLSWTQVDMWERSPERYVRQYMLGTSRDFTNSGMEYGSKTSAALENGDAEGDDLLSLATSLIRAYDCKEEHMEAFLDTPNGRVKLLGKLDTFRTTDKAFREYKTGRTKWTQGKADKHGQMKHYATLIWLKYGIITPEAHLDWLETDEVDGEVRFTGNIQEFHVKLGMSEILEYMSRVSRVAQEIDHRYRQEMKNLT